MQKFLEVEITHERGLGWFVDIVYKTEYGITSKNHSVHASKTEALDTKLKIYEHLYSNDTQTI